MSSRQRVGGLPKAVADATYVANSAANYVLTTDGTTITARPLGRESGKTTGTDLGAIINALAANGVCFEFGPGQFPATTTINLDGKIGVTLRGQGGLNDQNKSAVAAAPVSSLVMTGTSATLLSAINGQGVVCVDLGLVYNNINYTGQLLNFTGALASASRHCRLVRCYVGPIGSGKWNTGQPLLDLWRTVNFKAESCGFYGGDCNVRGQRVGVATADNFSNVVVFDTCRFEKYVVTSGAVQNAGQSWRFTGSHTEPGNGASTTLALLQDPTLPAWGVTFEDHWFGDANTKPTVGGAYIAFNGNGLRVVGGYASLNNDYGLVYVNRDGTSAQATAGITVENVMFDSISSSAFVVDTGTSTDTSDIYVSCPLYPSNVVNGRVSSALRVRGTAKVRSVTGTTQNPTLADEGGLLICNASGAAITVNLPANAPNGWTYTIKKGDSSANAVTITPATGVIKGSITSLASNNKYVTYTCDGGNWQVVGNN